MANHIKYAVSVDVIDEITRTVAWTDDDDNSQGDNVVTTEYIHHHDIPSTIGGSVTAISNATGGIEVDANTAVTNMSAGTPTYSALDTSGGKYAVGVANTIYDGVFIKHTGFTDGNFDTKSYEWVTVWFEYSSTNYKVLCSIPSGGCIFLPNTPAMGASLSLLISASSNLVGTASAATIHAQIVTIT